jgi:hypothetical protein
VPGFLSSRQNWLPPPPPYPQASVAPTHLVPGGGGHTRLRKRRWEEPIRTKGRTRWYSSYSMIPIRTEPMRHKVPRMPQCLSPRPNPPPIPQNQRRREHNRLQVRGWGGPNSNDLRNQPESSANSSNSAQVHHATLYQKS